MRLEEKIRAAFLDQSTRINDELEELFAFELELSLLGILYTNTKLSSSSRTVKGWQLFA